MYAEITLFEKAGGPLTKRYHLTNGKLENDDSACHMIAGVASRVLVDLGDMSIFAALIGGFKSNEAYAIGRLKPGLPDKVKVVTKPRLAAAQKTEPTTIARTTDYLGFAKGEPGLVLLDIDVKDMSPAVKAAIGGPASHTHLWRAKDHDLPCTPTGVEDTDKDGVVWAQISDGSQNPTFVPKDDLILPVRGAGGYWEAVCMACPALKTAARVVRPSTSTGIRNSATGEACPGSGGFHVVVAVADSADIPRFLETLHDRLWLNGFGWGSIGGPASSLNALVDKACRSPRPCAPANCRTRAKVGEKTSSRRGVARWLQGLATASFQITAKRLRS